jgi:hypothetical protein
MNAKPTLARPNAATTLVVAALSALIGFGLLSAVAASFQRDGAPLERVVVAERACAGYAYASERSACVRDYLAMSRRRDVAGR